MQTKPKAFTLVELLVVITIIAILATLSFVSFQGFTKDARDANRLSNIKEIQKGVESYILKAGNYPEPDNAVSYTGGLNSITVIKQGIVGDSLAKNINMQTVPLDPKDQTNYTYSISGNGQYYQTSITKENKETAYNPSPTLPLNLMEGGMIIPKAYASTPTTIVSGYYKIDPSLPSLIVTPSSVTGSGIFDPNVCFIMNGGKNTLTSCVETKANMSLKDYDKSLVGYWDMETICNGTNCGDNTNSGKLKDLSGNSNNGTFSGGMVYSGSLTGGLVGMGIQFSNSGYSIEIPDTITGSVLDLTNYTQEIIISYLGGTNSIFFSKGILPDYNLKMACYPTGFFAGKEQLKVGNWYSLTRTYNSTTGEEKNFINGYLISTNIRIGFYKPNNYPIVFGRYLGDKNYPLYGIIDDAKLYNRILSDDEIMQQAEMAGF